MARHCFAVFERPNHIVVVGARGDEDVGRLYGAALVAPQPLRTVQLLDPSDPGDAARMAARGVSPAAAPTAYTCRGQSCLVFTP